MLRLISQRSVPTVQAMTLRGLSTDGGKVDDIQRKSEKMPLIDRQKSAMEGIQGRDVEFTSSSSRAVSAGAIEQASRTSVERQNSTELSSDGPAEQYNKTGNVNLYGCMQSTVPEPYHGGGPTHLNMPGGGAQRESKYLSGKLQNSLHPKGSRGFRTWSVLRMSHPKGIVIEDPCPQGVQGDECVQYELWKSNCVRFQLSNCDEQLESFKSGRKTLADIFDEQERIIRDIVNQQSNRETSSQSATSSSSDSHDEPISQSRKYPDLLGHSVQSLLGESQPCPQGVQGLQCAQFKEWLHNCNRYGLSDCENQLQELGAGRRTLAQIIQEQEEQIERIARLYRSRQRPAAEVSARSLSQGSRVSQTRQVHTQGSQSSQSHESGSGSSQNSSSHSQGAGTPQLSQKQRLQRAVKEYGATVVVFHVTISLMSLGGFYLAVSSGIDMVGLLQGLGVGETVLKSGVAAGASTFVVAYAVHKVFAPVRIACTLTCTPFIVRYLRKVGFLKPPKTKI